MTSINTLVAMVADASLESRERWFVEMNCWRCPDDFPVKLPDFTGREREQRQDPEWARAWHAVNVCLTEEEKSRAWWLLELKCTEDQWRHWWNNERKWA